MNKTTIDDFIHLFTKLETKHYGTKHSIVYMS
jgi:hypothetical protein